jgi:hypothetical protein
MFRKDPMGCYYCLLLFLLTMPSRPACAQAREYQIKAAFLFNFTQFVEWPAAAFSGPGAPLCIGVLGDDPFGAALEDTVRGESIQNHKLSIRRGQRVEDLTDCQMVFVSKSENDRVPRILAKIDSRPVVTVSELTGFAQQGGTINFYREQNKVRFEINLASARQSGLKISSQLLGLGRIVETAKTPK